MKAADTVMSDHEIHLCYMEADIPKLGYVENSKAIAKYVAQKQAGISFEAGQRESQSRIGELEAQLADINNQFKREIEAARKKERQAIHALWGEFSDSEDYDLVSDHWKRKFSTFFVSWP